MAELNTLEEAIRLQLIHRGIDVTPGASGPDLIAQVATSAGIRTMSVEIKGGHPSARRPAPSYDKQVMLAEWFIPPKRAHLLRASGTPFVDSVGNMWLDLPGFVIDVEGRPRPAGRHTVEQQADRLSRPASLRVIFALLILPDLVQTTLRELARVCGTSLGAAQAAMADLTRRGFVYEGESGRRLAKTGALADRWVSDYTSRLLPKLQTVSLRGPRPEWWFGHQKEVIKSSAALGGETAYELRGYPLRSLVTLVYGRPPWGQVRKLGHLSAEGSAQVVLRERFWPATDSDDATTPSLLVYADLVNSDEPRQLEAATQMRKLDADLRRLWS